MTSFEEEKIVRGFQGFHFVEIENKIYFYVTYVQISNEKSHFLIFKYLMFINITRTVV